MKIGRSAQVALAVSGCLIGISGCLGLPTSGPAKDHATLTPGIVNHVTLPMTMNGAIAVGFSLPSQYRRIAANIVDLDHVDLELTGSASATATLTFQQINTGMNSEFNDLLPGDYLLTAIARASSDVELNRATQSATVVEAETAYVTIELPPFEAAPLATLSPSPTP